MTPVDLVLDVSTYCSYIRTPPGKYNWTIYVLQWRRLSLPIL